MRVALTLLAGMTIVFAANEPDVCWEDSVSTPCSKGYKCVSATGNACDMTTMYWCKCVKDAPPGPPPGPPVPVPPKPEGTTTLEKLFTEEMFYQMFPKLKKPISEAAAACNGARIWTYDSLVYATTFFPDFLSSKNATDNKVELAAFLGQGGHETSGGWPNATEPTSWGLCYIEEVGGSRNPITANCATTTIKNAKTLRTHPMSANSSARNTIAPVPTLTTVEQTGLAITDSITTSPPTTAAGSFSFPISTTTNRPATPSKAYSTEGEARQLL